MQTSLQAFKAAAAPRPCRRNPSGSGPVRCQQPRLPLQEAAKNAALATVTASLLLGLGLPAEAAKRPPSYYEKRDAYEAEFKAAVDARGGRPTVTESPKGPVVKAEAKVPPLNFSDYKKATDGATQGLTNPLTARR